MPSAATGTVLGLLMRSLQALMNMAMVILFPLTLASNISVDPHTMPLWLRAIVDANPGLAPVAAARAAMNGIITCAQLGGVFASCAGLIAIFAPLTMRLYRNNR